jgi:hypothetical protein
MSEEILHLVLCCSCWKVGDELLLTVKERATRVVFACHNTSVTHLTLSTTMI